MLTREEAELRSVPAPATTKSRASARWLSWLLSCAILAAVVLATLHFSEEREFMRLAEDAEPWWIAWALLLQGGTYLAQGEAWLVVLRAAKVHISRVIAYQLSLAKLFVDQALPTGGISGTLVVVNALTQRGVPRNVVMASVIVDTVSYYTVYVLALAGALAISIAGGRASALIVTAAALFVTFSVALAVVALALSGRKLALPRRLARHSLLKKALELLQEAEPKLTRSPRLILRSGAFQLAVVLLDAATLWMLIRALGHTAQPSGVFASFMISSLLRTVSVVPGGLGVFEGASVVTLKLAGVPIPVALAATLLFRGLSFWLPMLPGLFFSHRTAGQPKPGARSTELDAYWTLTREQLEQRLGSSPGGLSAGEAARRLALYGSNELSQQRSPSRWRTVKNQLRSPLILLLVFAAGASALTGNWVDAGIVLAILFASVAIGYFREYRAQTAAAVLSARVRTHASVLRDGQLISAPLAEVVPGDVVQLSAGSLVPADAVLLQATDCFVNEAVLTGESFPAEKRAGVVAPGAELKERVNCVFLGTNVRSGTARAIVVDTGTRTHFGAIARRLVLRPPETEFDRGLRHFGYLLSSAMLVIVLLVFAGNMLLGRPPIETLLFSIALAVGLSPELLPAILSVNLSRGAQAMARVGVLVKRLNAIENLGSMDVLCTDKTGTLTEGVVRLEGAYDANGERSGEVLELAAQNATHQAGLTNPLDEAIMEAQHEIREGVEKLGEIPYDFVRKRLSVVIRGPTGVRLITKGAFESVLQTCTRTAEGAPLDAALRGALTARFSAWSAEGTRVLAVATRALPEAAVYGRADEYDLDFVGFLTFLDSPKQGAAEALSQLRALGVSVKLITGDTKLVAQHVASKIGMRPDRVLTGKELDELHDEALWRSAESTELFVEVDPNQKERIILSLKKMGHVVGFLGDGINDAPAMHAADTSLSVDQAVDVAKEAADFVLLKRDLDVIRSGIAEGRKTFANTLKYVLTTTSANLGNMVSMAAASMLLPFLPLLAGQILLNNFLSDVPAIGIADDSVDIESVAQPRRWSMPFIGRFMLEFGVLSSCFDFLTFGVLLWMFAATPELFRTGWFVESLLTELVIALVVRTRRPFYRSRPGKLLLVSTLVLIAVAFAVPYLPFAGLLGFTPLPLLVVAALIATTVLYILATELMKLVFYRGSYGDTAPARHERDTWTG